MCGLIGMASTEKGLFVTKRKDTFLECLFASTLRGDDSTGVALVRNGGEKDQPEIFKKAMAAPDFAQMGRFNKYMENFSDYSVVMGHTRAATYATVKDRNAHPFQDGHITLTHNGHISNAHTFMEFKDWPSGVEVDSHRMCLAMARLGEEEALVRAEGAFALAWYNSDRQTLNFARNSQRPLKFAFIRGQNTMFYGSERLMLRWRLEENGLEVEGQYKEPVPGCWVEFDLKDLRNFKLHRFTSRPRVIGNPAGRPSDLPWPGHVTPPKTTTPDSKLTTIGNTAGTGTIERTQNHVLTYQHKVITDILKNLQVPDGTYARNLKVVQKNSGRPTKNKNKNKMELLLNKHGLTYDQPVLIQMGMFEEYQQQPDHGKVHASIRTKVYNGSLQNIRRAEFLEMAKLRSVLVRIVGATLVGDKKELKLLFERHPLYREFAKAEAERYKPVVQEGSKSPPEPVNVVVPLPTSYSGPYSRNISLDRFNELCKHGCCYCQGDIDPKDHKAIGWIGEAPICTDCDKEEQFNVTH